MPWNWELPDWPRFTCNALQILKHERLFLMNVGKAIAFLTSVGKQDYEHFIVEILSSEGLESSKIEGELLDRESLQSSIRQHFGLKASRQSDINKESCMADLLCNVYETFDQPLTHEMLCHWHLKLFEDWSGIDDLGKYRTHSEPMQIISGRYDRPRVFFEAPPSARVHREMTGFLDWFNSTRHVVPLLVRAAIAHVYFESIHPFEDGNGRIGRLLVEKVLSQGVNRPLLVATSKILEKRKKEYYAGLEACNRTLEVSSWVEFFADVVLQAQMASMCLLTFLIEKSRMLTRLAGQLNLRQEKALLRIFSEGVEGFKGGMSAENYIAITKASRATATRDLADLVEKCALIKTGELRHTRYWLNLPKEPMRGHRSCSEI